MATAHQNHSLSPHFKQITISTGAPNDKQHERDHAHVVGAGGSLLRSLPFSTETQTFKIFQRRDKIHITDTNDVLLAVFEKGNDGHALMVVRDAAGESVAVLKEKKPPKDDKSMPLTPKTDALRLYGHKPLYLGQVPKRKRTYNGPPPLYLWGRLEKKAGGLLLGGSTKFFLHVPFVPAEVVYTIATRGRQQTLGMFQSLSQKKILSMPFQTKSSNDNSSAEENENANNAESQKNNTKKVGDASSQGCQERKVTCHGKECAILRRYGNRTEQTLSVHADTDPLLMAFFFAATNQLFEMQT